MSENAQALLVSELRRFFSPLLAAKSPTSRRALFAEMGWDFDALTGFPVSTLTTAITNVGNTLDGLNVSPTTFDELRAVLASADAARQTVLGVLSQFQPPAQLAADYQNLPADLLELLAYRYLRFQHPVAYSAAQLLTIVRPRDPTSQPTAYRDPTTKEIARFPIVTPKLDLGRLGQLLQDPVGALQREYFGPQGLADHDAVSAAAQRLFPLVAALLNAVGAGGVVPDPSKITTAEWGAVGASLVASSMYSYLRPADDIEVGAIVTLSAADRGDLGVVVSPLGKLSVENDLGAWSVTITAQGTVKTIAIGKAGVQVVDASGAESTTARLRLEIVAEKLAGPTGAALLVGSVTGTRLEVGQLSLRAHLDVGAGHRDYGIGAGATSGAVVIASSETDSFLRAFLPANELRIAFDLDAGWSYQRGLYLGGTSGIAVEIPVRRTIGGLVKIDAIHLAARPGSAGAIDTVVAITAGLKVGPVSAAVEQVGLRALITFPPKGGNLGAAHAAVGFKPPAGAGLAVGAGPVRGGGYLYFDADKGEYAGALELTVGPLSLKALGLLTTKLPGGQPGFSLIVIITAEFPPIQLGWGFTLLGVGGLVGIHRTVAVDALRDGVRTHALDAVLFPKDPAGNAPALLAALRTVFPPAQDRFTLGPMVKLGWGAASLIELELALILELPAPLTLVVLGRIVVTLPTKLTPAVYLRLDVAGVLDIDRGEVSVDASLIESRLGTYPVNGDMALRAGWKATKRFALAAGGFHPKFQPPPAFPALQRLSIDVSSGELMRVRLEAYLAVTAGIVQFGARAEVFAGVKTDVGSFTATGTGTLDALIHLDPFAFTAELFVHVDIAWNGTPYLAAQLEVTLSGPTPWHAFGFVQFNVLLLKPRIGIDITVGEAAPAPTPMVDLRTVIEPALRATDAWTAYLPEAPLVTLRDPTPGGVVVHPLGRFTVRQRVLPLDLTITRFGSAAPIPGTPDRFSITSVNVGTAAVASPPPVRDEFAAAQFIDLTDDEQLSRPGFESMPSGAIGSTEQHRWPVTAAGAPDAAVVDITYDVSIIDEADVTQLLPAAVLESGLVASAWATGAAAHAPVRTQGDGAMVGADRPVVVVGERYTGADVDRLPKEPHPPAGASSYTEARERLAPGQQLVTVGEVTE